MFKGTSEKIAEMQFEAHLDGDTMVMTLSGTADARVHQQLRELISANSDESAKAAVARVLVDFRKLEFMNSSCFKQFVTWIVAVRKLPADRQYSIEFQSNPDFHWQARSLGALKALGAGIVKVLA